MRFNQQPNSRAALRLVRNENAQEATIYVYDVIDSWFGISSQAFIDTINALDVQTLHVRINSPGGSVFEGMAIANAMREHKAKMVVHVDALAASIASVIAMAGDEVRMSDNGFLMIHDPWTIVMGDSGALRKEADILDRIGGSIVNEYAKRTGQDSSTIRDWMREETWFDATEAKDEGFIDVIENGANEKSDTQNLFDLGKFRHAPAALLSQSNGGTSAPSLRDAERALRDAGFTRSQAKRVALAGFSALGSQRDADDFSDLKTGLQKLLNNINTR